jgi:hypothetical protein
MCRQGTEDAAVEPSPEAGQVEPQGFDPEAEAGSGRTWRCEVAAQLREISPKTIDRLLERERKVRCLKLERNPRVHPLLYQRMPVKVASGLFLLEDKHTRFRATNFSASWTDDCTCSGTPSKKGEIRTQTGLAIIPPVLASYGLCYGGTPDASVFLFRGRRVTQTQSSAIPLSPRGAMQQMNDWARLAVDPAWMKKLAPVCAAQNRLPVRRGRDNSVCPLTTTYHE